MSNQPTPDVDDPTVPDDQLPKADRDRIRTAAQGLIDGALRTDSDDFQALPARVRRRAWVRYQAHFEPPERERERNAAHRASAENTDALERDARARRR